MNAAPSANTITFISRRAIGSLGGALAFALLCLTASPAPAAEPPPDQIKAAGAITLTTALLDKMDAFIKSMSSDKAAKAELAAVSKDPSITPENWGSVISAKRPKTVELF